MSAALAGESPEPPEGNMPLGRPAWALSGDDILVELDALHASRSRIEARRLELVARLEQLEHARDLGARDTAELLALRHRLDVQQVRRDVRLALALPRYPVVQAALDTGPCPEVGAATGPCAEAEDGAATGPGAVVEESSPGSARPMGVHVAQAEVIVTALERVPATVPVDDLAVAEEQMVIAARVLSPGDLRRLGRGVVERLDPDGPEPIEDAAREQEALWLGRSFHGRGVRFRGFLANENAELFQTLIDTCAKPRKTPEGELDPRSKAQRQADALSQILRAAATTGGDIPTHGGIRPHIIVTIGLQELVEAGKHHTGNPLFGHGLSAATVRQLACDAQIIPMVLGTDSQPLDVGRDHRTVTPTIRKALIARDRGCVIPGCGAPPGHCDAHHLQHWAHDGPTSVENSALVCPPHHRAIHNGTWTIHITNGVVHTTRPHWTEPTTRRNPTERPPPDTQT